MERDAQQRRRVEVARMWGPLTRLGLLVAVASAAIDQAAKLWLLYVFDLRARAPVRLTPFLDLVMAWNKGISYGLFQQDGRSGNGCCWRSRLRRWRCSWSGSRAPARG